MAYQRLSNPRPRHEIYRLAQQVDVQKTELSYAEPYAKSWNPEEES